MNVLIWDAPDQPPSELATGCKVVHWRGYASEKCGEDLYVLSLVEKSPLTIRNRFLRRIYELGELKVNEKRLVDHLEIRDGFSAWWMSLLAEKCNYTKSRQIDDAVKFLAFAGWANGRKLHQITLASNRRQLAECVRSWCEKSSIQYEEKKLDRATLDQSWLKKIHDLLPHFLQGIGWLVRHVWRIRELRGVGVQEWRFSRPQVAFISYLFNLETKSIKSGLFESRYWTLLPQKLRKTGTASNWLHLFVKGGPFDSNKNAARWIRKLNKKKETETHTILEAFLSWSVLWQTLKDYFCLVWNSSFLKIEKRLRRISVNLWPFFREDWEKSTKGCVAMSNCLYLNLFEAAFRGLPRETVGVYLQENQGWEFGCIWAWKSTGLGRLIGHPHSTVRFWDLRHFYDPRTYNQSSRHTMPRPDFVAVNGPAAKKIYLCGKYPQHELIEVEALRYLYLQNLQKNSDWIKLNKLKPKIKKKHPHELLVLGDYDRARTVNQLLMLKGMPQSFISKIVFKPHPACPVNKRDFPFLSFTTSREKINQLVRKYKWAFSSATTSAALDCLLAGLRTFVVLDNESLNHSPVRNLKGAFFVTKQNAIFSIIKTQKYKHKDTFHQRPYFNLEPSLEKWQGYLDPKRKIT